MNLLEYADLLDEIVDEDWEEDQLILTCNWYSTARTRKALSISREPQPMNHLKIEEARRHRRRYQHELTYEKKVNK
uniref:Uncharacterized protein n=1 Tax=Romanomermis culicivorax TaxID=13658 RepID=A0A915HYT6_ROMCU